MAAHLKGASRFFITGRPRPSVIAYRILPFYQGLRNLGTESKSAKDDNRKELDEDYFYCYASGPCVRNGLAELRPLHLKFNIPALKKSVIDAVEGATSIVDIGKYCERRLNKMILTTDNGKQVMASLAYPQRVGCTEQAIESEVATMEFVHSRIGVPVPRVLGWCTRPEDRDVNAAYILTEQVKGRAAAQVWDTLSLTQKVQVVDEVVEIHRKMLAVDFPAYGSIYHQGAIKGHSTIPIDEEYIIGPGVSLALTDEGCHKIDVFRGPWTSAEEYIQSLIDVEKQWINEHANPETCRGFSYQRSNAQNPKAHLDLLHQVRTLMPWTTFHDNPELRKPILWHPKFSSEDIIISDDALKGKSSQIVSLINWQHSIIGPLYMQTQPPVLFTNLKHRDPKLQNESEIVELIYYNKCVEDKDLAGFGKLIRIDLCQILQKMHNGCFKLWEGNCMEVRKCLLDLESKWPLDLKSPTLFLFPTSDKERQRFEKEYEAHHKAFDISHKNYGTR